MFQLFGELKVPGELSQIPRIQEFVRQTAAQASLPEESIYHCQLATDEACTNIIEHGYAKSKSPLSITLRTTLEHGFLCITIFDEGPAFNPLTIPDHKPPQELKSSGWGLHFIHTVMDKVEYQRLDNRNCLILYKRTPSPSR
jgi:anti-sigma regulatory factor (Ser/Thr protein kinase)